MWHKDYHVANLSFTNGPIKIEDITYVGVTTDFLCYLAQHVKTNDPTNFRDAKSEAWVKAMNGELDALEENHLGNH